MRKIMFAALMIFATSTAFAGDSEALKAVLKIKNYTEAASLLKSSLDQMASSAEKAKAYNHLVQLSMDKFNKEATVAASNEAKKQLQQPEEPFDTLG